MYEKMTQALIDFLNASPTPFHAVRCMVKILGENGFTPLHEGQPWSLQAGGRYTVTRNNSSLIAFTVPEAPTDAPFMIAASHSDSPAFKLKEKPILSVRGKYTRLNTEGYGGMLCSTWLDRPLSVAGRAVVRTGTGLETRLVCFDRDLVLIPSLAIHMDRTVNDGHAFNKQIDLLPLFGGGGLGENAMTALVAEALNVAEADVLGTDLYLYNRTPPSVWGANREFLSAPRLDDLQCAFASLLGFLQGHHRRTISVFACLDNEEVGSGTRQGADSDFLADTLRRATHALGLSEEDFARAAASGFLVSCDNAHAVHPNFPDKTDATNCAYLNGGLVIKSHAGQKYTSDAVSIALMKTLCERVGVPTQVFANRSDMSGGSTLGNIAVRHLPLNAVDVGLPQLAMHSAYETAGISDTEALIRALTAFYNARFTQREDGCFIVE